MTAPKKSTLADDRPTREEELAEQKAVEEDERRRRDESEIEVLRSIRKQGYWWPGE